jgi:hypothetical protein
MLRAYASPWLGGKSGFVSFAPTQGGESHHFNPSLRLVRIANPRAGFPNVASSQGKLATLYAFGCQPNRALNPEHLAASASSTVRRLPARVGFGPPIRRNKGR